MQSSPCFAKHIKLYGTNVKPFRHEKHHSHNREVVATVLQNKENFLVRCRICSRQIKTAVKVVGAGTARYLHTHTHMHTHTHAHLRTVCMLGIFHWLYGENGIKEIVTPKLPNYNLGRCFVIGVCTYIPGKSCVGHLFLLKTVFSAGPEPFKTWGHNEPSCILMYIIPHIFG